VLDNKRLGKQRSECKIILKTLLGTYKKEGRKGWPHHPATKMWTGCERALVRYSIAICDEWIARGHNDSCRDWFAQVGRDLTSEAAPLYRAPTPEWLGNEEFHRSHRSNLIRKDPNHYRHRWPDIPDDLPYVWPV
jgi:hypothetical protein